MKCKTQNFLYLLLTSVLFQTVMANDSFYQGGGSSLRPLNNPQMRVIEEKLLIHPMPQPVCYRLRFRGRFLDEVTNATRLTQLKRCISFRQFLLLNK